MHFWNGVVKTAGSTYPVDLTAEKIALGLENKNADSMATVEGETAMRHLSGFTSFDMSAGIQGLAKAEKGN